MSQCGGVMVFIGFICGVSAYRAHVHVWVLVDGSVCGVTPYL